MQPLWHTHPQRRLRFRLIAHLVVIFGVAVQPLARCVAQNDVASSSETNRPPTSNDELLIPTLVVEGLNHPRGAAIQPGTGLVYFAESGAGRVARIVDGRVQPVVTGFSREPFPGMPPLQIGPLSMVFLPNEMMVIGEGGQADGSNQLYAIRIPAASKPAVSITSGISFSPADSSGGGNFFGMTRSATSIFTVVSGADSAWIGDMRLPKGDGKFDEKVQYGPLGRLIITSPPPDGSRPLAEVMAITRNAGGELLIGEAGDFGDAADSSISFIRVNDGRRLLHLRTGLQDIVGLAYSEKEPRDLALYALDFAAATPERGGLYRLEATLTAGRQAIKAVPIAKLAHPTSLAFGPNGELYVTELGLTPTVTSGRLLRFEPGL